MTSWRCCSEIQGLQMTHAFVHRELKLVTRVTTKLSSFLQYLVLIQFNIQNYIHAYIHTYIHTYIYSYIDTDIHAYILPCLPACLHTYTYSLPYRVKSKPFLNNLRCARLFLHLPCKLCMSTKERTYDLYADRV